MKPHTEATLRNRRDAEILALKKGVSVRLHGWQMHWPRQDAVIVSVDKGGAAELDRPVCGQRCWHVSDLAKSF